MSAITKSHGDKSRRVMVGGYAVMRRSASSGVSYWYRGLSGSRPAQLRNAVLAEHGIEAALAVFAAALELAASVPAVAGARKK